MVLGDDRQTPPLAVDQPVRMTVPAPTAASSPNGSTSPLGALNPVSVTRWVYLMAGGLIAMAAACMIFIGVTASAEADRHALSGEKQLFAEAIQRNHIRMSRAQLARAHSSEAVAQVEDRFDPAFVRDRLLRPLWREAELESSFLIAPDGTLLASSERNEVHFERRRLTANDPLSVLAAQQRRALVRAWPKSGGPEEGPLPQIWSDDTASYSFALVNGAPSLLSAVAIETVTGGSARSPERTTVLISARVIDASFLDALQGELPFPDVSFRLTDTPSSHQTHVQVQDASGVAFGYFHWNGAKPGPKILRMIGPLIVVMGLALAVSSVLVARRIGRLSRALEESEAANRRLALHDPLTGLANRFQFTALLDEALSDCASRPIALFGCDLDRFKAVNDRFGHAAGDLVIQSVAERLAAVTADQGTVARIGGDEFVILVALGGTASYRQADGSPGLSKAERTHLQDLADRLIAAVDQPVMLACGDRVSVGLSIGIAVAPLCGMRDTDLIAAADAALYGAKDSGRGCAVFFDDRSAQRAEASTATHASPPRGSDSTPRRTGTG